MIVILVTIAVALSRGIAADPVDGSTELALVDAVRHGADYYTVLADMARSSGLAASGWMTPLPTLFLIEGRLPAWCASTAMVLIVVAVVVAWYARFGGLLTTRTARVVALLLMLAGVAVALGLPLVAVPEGWAGLLVALSLARWSPGCLVESAALGLAATTISCAALPYAAVMALAAGREQAWREVGSWALVLAIGLTLVLLHGHALTLALPIHGADAVARVLAPGLAVATLGSATGLRLLPFGLALPLVVLATIGWISRREPVALRVAGLIVAQATVIALVGLPAVALVVAPLLPLGLIAVPDGLGDLVAAALDRRRITVTRHHRDKTSS